MMVINGQEIILIIECSASNFERYHPAIIPTTPNIVEIKNSMMDANLNILIMQYYHIIMPKEKALYKVLMLGWG